MPSTGEPPVVGEQPHRPSVWTLPAYKVGQTVVERDTQTSDRIAPPERPALAAMRMTALISVPSAQRTVSLWARWPVSQAEPRDWTEAEIRLVEDTAERIWDAIERALVENNLRKSEARFRLMADAVPQIVWITDAEGGVEFFNRQWADYIGTPDLPPTAADVADSHIHAEDVARTMEAFEAARTSGGVFEVEHRIRGKNGGYRWFLVRAEPYRDPETGEIVRWFGASTDIHDRKMAEERLRESEARLRLAVDVGRLATGIGTSRRAALMVARALPDGGLCARRGDPDPRGLAVPCSSRRSRQHHGGTARRA